MHLSRCGAWLTASALLITGCAQPKPAELTNSATPRSAHTTATPTDLVTSAVADGRQQVEAFFGAPFPRPFELHVVPSRAAFSELAKQRWSMPDTQCWMVGIGTGSILAVLDPAVWKTDACEHDPADEKHIRQLIAHELTHVYHGQHNPRPEFDNMDELGWFVEGLAVLVSGQFDDARHKQVEQAARDGALPTRLEDVWSGKYRYARAGSLADYVDHRFGRQTVKRLLTATSNAEALSILGTTEPTLLADWERLVRTVAAANLDVGM